MYTCIYEEREIESERERGREREREEAAWPGTPFFRLWPRGAPRAPRPSQPAAASPPPARDHGL